MKAIFASKLYKASSRKDRIQAALNSLGNSELVQQLASSLDEEYKTPTNLGVEDQVNEESEVDDDLIVDEEIDPENDLVTIDDMANSMKSSGSHSPAPSHHSSAPSSSPDKESDDKPDVDTSELMPDSPALEDEAPKKVTKIEKKTEEPTEASTKVTATTEVKINPVPAAATDLNILKATLNNREDTAGVSRIAEKENEIWIYYKDEVNLNTIMTNVIEMLMNSADYKNFTFNRLARSDNAIVFEVTLESYTYPEKSVEPAAETQS